MKTISHSVFGWTRLHTASSYLVWVFEVSLKLVTESSFSWVFSGGPLLSWAPLSSSRPCLSSRVLPSFMSCIWQCNCIGALLVYRGSIVLMISGVRHLNIEQLFLIVCLWFGDKPMSYPFVAGSFLLNWFGKNSFWRFGDMDSSGDTDAEEEIVFSSMPSSSSWNVIEQVLELKSLLLHCVSFRMEDGS